MEKKVNIRLPKGKEAKNVQFNVIDGKIEVSYDLKEKFNPKYGDFIISENGLIFIFDEDVETSYKYPCAKGYIGESRENNKIYAALTYSLRNARYATKEEKSAFLERLEKEYGKIWNAETKTLEDIRWIPYHNQEYWYINEDFVPIWDKFSNKNTDHISRIKSNNCFKTEEAAQKVADQIKEIFKNSKAE